jgi:membrane-associated phospholipid phosphatase
MQNNDEIISKKGLILIIVVFIAALILGLILLSLGYNDSFSSDSKSVRAIFRVVTTLGEPIVFIVVIGIFYIAYNKRFAKNLALNLMVSTYLNSLLKDIIQDPRPASNFDSNKISPENPQGLSTTSYGFPSGHNQIAVSAWGYIAYNFRKRLWVVLLMTVIIFLVGLSRLVLGVHDIQDVFGGILIGLVLLVLFILFEPPASKKFKSLSMQFQIILVVILSAVLFLLGTLLFPTTELQLLPDPPKYTDKGNYPLVGGVLLGFGLGYILENRHIKYDPGKLNSKQRILNLIVGMVIAFVFFFGLEGIKGVFDSVFFRYIRYAVVSFVLAFVVPLVLMKINREK